MGLENHQGWKLQGKELHQRWKELQELHRGQEQEEQQMEWHERAQMQAAVVKVQTVWLIHFW